MKGRNASRILLCLVIALAVLIVTGPWQLRLETVPAAANAHLDYQLLQIEEPYVVLDSVSLDLRQKPVLVLGECAELEMLAAVYCRIPLSQRPELVWLGGWQTLPGIMEGLDCHCCARGCVPAPSLLLWGPEGLEGYSFGAVDELLVKMQYPRLIGKGQVYNNPADPSGNNSLAAARQSSFVVVKPGQEYHFYDHVCPSREYGYQEGLSIFQSESGQYIWGFDLGGGICKTATVLHYAVIDAGLPVTSRGCHSLPVSYAAPGEDVAVSRSGGQDYSFLNHLSHPLVVVFNQRDDGILTAALYEVLDVEQARTDVERLMAAEPLAFDEAPPLFEVKKPGLDGPPSEAVSPASLQIQNPPSPLLTGEAQKVQNIQ